MKNLFYLLVSLLILIVVVLLLSLMLSPPTAGRKIAEAFDMPYRALIAHRGASYLAPESTAAAYEIARDMGADYLELDLQRTKDGVVVVFHDSTLERTTNVSDVFPGRENDRLETFTYEELIQLDAGSWFNEQFPDRARASYVGLKILTLQEVITIAERGNNNPGLYLETKDAPYHPGIERDLLRILSTAGWLESAPSLTSPDETLNMEVGAPDVNVAVTPARIIFQSFYHESLAVLSEMAPDIPRVLLISAAMEDEAGWEYWLDRAEEVAQGIGPVGYLGFPWNIGPAHRRDLLVHPYTINAPWQMKLLTFFGADGFFTDRTAIALEVLGKTDQLDIEKIILNCGY